MPADSCCRRLRCSTNGAASSFSKKPAERPACHRQPGSKVQSFTVLQPRFSHDSGDSISSYRSGVPEPGADSAPLVRAHVHDLVHPRLLPAEEPGETETIEIVGRRSV